MTVSSFWVCELINNTDYFYNSDHSSDTIVRQRLPQLVDDLMRDECFDEVIIILNFLGGNQYFRDYFCYALDVIAEYPDVDHLVYINLKQNTAYVLNEEDYLEFQTEQPDDCINFKPMTLSELGALGQSINRKLP